MAEVLRFPQRAHQPTGQLASAEIVILPAIRIERATDAVIVRDRGAARRGADRIERGGPPDAGGDVA